MERKYWQEFRMERRLIELYRIRDDRVRDTAIRLFAELYIGHNVIVPELGMEWMAVVGVETDFSRSLAPVFVCRRSNGEEVKVGNDQIAVADRVESDPNEGIIHILSSERPEMISRMLAYARRSGVYSLKGLFDLAGREVRAGSSRGTVVQFVWISDNDRHPGMPLFEIKLHGEATLIPECPLSELRFTPTVALVG